MTRDERTFEIIEYLCKYKEEYPQRVKQTFLDTEEDGVFIELFSGEMFHVSIKLVQ